MLSIIEVDLGEFSEDDFQDMFDSGEISFVKFTTGYRGGEPNPNIEGFLEPCIMNEEINAMILELSPF